MDPTQQQSEQQPQQPQPPTSPAGPPQMPKLSLGQLAALCAKDRDDETLSGHTRTFAGRMHQFALHLQVMGTNIAALAGARKKDLKGIDNNFQQIGVILQQLTGAEGPSAEGPQEGTAAAPPQPEQATAELVPGPEVVGAPPAGEPVPAVAVAVPRQPQPQQKRARTNGTAGA